MSEGREHAPGPLQRARWLVLTATAAAAAGLALAVALPPLESRREAREAYPVVSGALPLPGLASPVEVLRDERGVPHVRARSEPDAYRALGFVHAQDRLAQMVWLARSAQGRAAELAGPAAVEADRVARTLGIGRLAQAGVARLRPATRSALDAYAGGVNAMLMRIRAGRAAPPPPLEGVDLEDWRPADSLAIVKLYAWGLGSSVEASLVLSDLIERLGGFGARLFFHRPGGFDAPPRPGARPQGKGSRSAFVDPLRSAAGLHGRSVGSNAWLLGAARSASGKPLLASDAHLEATAPAFFYEAHFRGGELDVAGATLPGVPVVWTGRNRRVAWASAHAGAVVTDLYAEAVDPDAPSRYHDGDGWRELAARRERIRVRGGADRTLVVRETGHGPLINPLLDGSREPLAVAWTGARTGDTLRGLLEASRARSVEELRAALAHHEEPVLVFLLADAQGAAGMQVAGWVPERRLPTGLAPVPGRSRWYEWAGRLSAGRLPRAGLPAGGWLIAADEPLPRYGGSGRIEWLWRGDRRASRIDELLRQATRPGPLDAAGMAKLQMDVRSGGASELLADALGLLAGSGGTALRSEEREAASRLRAWDGRATAESVGAGLYHVFVRHLTRDLLSEWVGPRLFERYRAVPQADPRRVVAEIVSAAAAGLPAFGGHDRESVAAAVRRSLRAAWLDLAVRSGANRRKWSWGHLHPLRFRPLFEVGEGRYRGGGLGPFPYPGDGVTVSTGEFDRTDPFETRVASTYRSIVDAAALDEALTSLAPGQSGHAGHPHQADRVERWLAGRPRLLPMSRLRVEQAARTHLLLEPSGPAP